METGLKYSQTLLEHHALSVTYISIKAGGNKFNFFFRSEDLSG
jgi:hypothetical protein